MFLHPILLGAVTPSLDTRRIYFINLDLCLFINLDLCLPREMIGALGSPDGTKPDVGGTMKRGPDLDITIAEDLVLSKFSLEENITCGRGEKIAAYYQDRAYSFNELSTLTNKVGNVLKQLGVGFEDRVLLVLQDCPEWLAGWFATMKIGGVATHAYTHLLSSDYDYFVGYARPKVVIVDSTTLGKVREAARSSNFPVKLLVAGGVSQLEKGEYSLTELIATASPVLEAERANKKNVAFWNFSGGTTGKPKGVPHTHEHGAIGFESYQRVIQYSPDDVVLRVPKLFFHYSRDLGMNYPLRAGAAVCLYPERTTPELMFELVAKYRPTILVNVPTMMRAMLQSAEARNADLSCLRVCLSSGELLSAQLYTEFTEKFGVEVSNVHGSAETYLGFFVNRPGEVRPGSSGKIAPLVEVKLLDTQGNEVPEGESGVLWVRSGASGWCYHQEPEKSKTTFPGDGWVNTNDLFREDNEGYFWYTGRSDDLIKVSGIYVAPLEIEMCLAQHGAVGECAVLGVKDADGLIKTKAFIVLKDGSVPSDQIAAELNTFCRRKMAAYKVPRFIEFLSELPKTGQGKIDKRKLLMRGFTEDEKSGHALTAI